MALRRTHISCLTFAWLRPGPCDVHDPERILEARYHEVLPQNLQARGLVLHVEPEKIHMSLADCF